MQPWQRAAIGAAFFLALHYTLLRAASGKIGDTIGALVVEVSAAVGILLYLLLGPKSDDPTTTRGFVFAMVSGFAVSVVSVLLFFALRKGGPVASTGTIVLGGGVAISALLAPFIYSEGFTWRRGIGVALGIAALVVLSTERTE